MDLARYSLSIAVSLVTGLAGFIAACNIFDRLTPGIRFSGQLNADNRSVAIFPAGLFIGLGLLPASAVKRDSRRSSFRHAPDRPPPGNPSRPGCAPPWSAISDGLTCGARRE